MTYNIAIPSYKRASQLQNKTLKCLHDNGIKKELINVFVVEEEYEEYLNVLDKSYYNELIIGKLGLVNQREFIKSYYDEGVHILSLDDDIEHIDLSLTNYNTLDNFITNAFNICVGKGSYIWSVYPVYNPFFRENKKDIIEGLIFLIGAFFGFVNRRDDDLKLILTTNNKEDVERSILYYLKDGITIRFNKVGFKTKYYGVGGLGGLKERIPIMKENAIKINEKYPNITKIKIRKNGLYEIVFKENGNPKNNKNKNVTTLNTIDENRADILEIKQLLNGITVTLCSNKIGRCRTFGKHRAMTLGYVKARITRNYGLSYYSKKYPLLYEALVKFGKTFVPFEFDAIHINHNVVCPRHLDSGNVGLSCLISIGKYEGCNLIIEGEGEFNTRYTPIVFDAINNYHWNTPLISGDKYSFVFLTQKK